VYNDSMIREGLGERTMSSKVCNPAQPQFIMSRTKRYKGRWYESGIPSWFKRMNRRSERSKQSQALREGKEIPVYKKRDSYDYW